MNLWIHQKYYIKCLYMDNKVQNFIDCKDKFNIRFSNIKFILTEECVRKIKNSTLGTLNNCNIEEICNSLKNNNKNLLVKIVNVILLHQTLQCNRTFF